MIHAPEDDLHIIRKILADHCDSAVQVYAFGSRATGKNLKPFSDLDLVLESKNALSDKFITNLKRAFSESDLPFRVDVCDWAALDKGFRDAIKNERVLIKI
jgi:predicted nucleotidyltransferase